MSRASALYVFVGVGGQGVLSAGEFLGQALFHKGTPVTVTQLHGMSQRGGSVQAVVQVGRDDVISPAGAPIDVLIALELLEAARVRPRLHPGSIAICNRARMPMSLAALKNLPLPEEEALVADLGSSGAAVHMIDGAACAHAAGHAATLNAVMLGALSCLPQCPASADELLAAMLAHGSPRAADFNKRAFALGRDAYSKGSIAA